LVTMKPSEVSALIISLLSGLNEYFRLLRLPEIGITVGIAIDGIGLDNGRLDPVVRC
jgi:hypothetical protein